MRRLVLAALAAPLLGAAPETGYDLVLRGGRVVDGSGNPWFVADVGVRGGRVAAIGRLDEAAAARVLDARGLVVAPGFIDVHAHVEASLPRRPTADNFVLDGVTTLVTGNCGGSDRGPAAASSASLRAGGISPNLATLIGHNSVRREAMGTEERDPTPEELAQHGGAGGARRCARARSGLSTGLIYVPGTYAKTAEVVALARVAARHGGVYASHIRSEGDQVFAAIDEAVDVGRQAGLPVQISHFKVSNKKLWGQSTKTIAQVDRARAAGLDVTVDQYPYTASSTNLGTLLPSWALAGGRGRRLASASPTPPRARSIAREMKDHIRRRNGRKRLDYAVVASCSWDRTRDGKSIARINEEAGRRRRLEDEIETVLEMVERGGAQMVYHSMDERDVERILRVPYAMVASDAGVVEPGVGVPHPRAYGTNARVLGRYVREMRTLRLEEAIRKMTSLPAQRFGLADRGLVRPGMWADLAVFDEATVADRATYEAPHAAVHGLPLRAGQRRSGGGGRPARGRAGTGAVGPARAERVERPALSRPGSPSPAGPRPRRARRRAQCRCGSAASPLSPESATRARGSTQSPSLHVDPAQVEERADDALAVVEDHGVPGQRQGARQEHGPRRRRLHAPCPRARRSRGRGGIRRGWSRCSPPPVRRPRSSSARRSCQRGSPRHRWLEGAAPLPVGADRAQELLHLAAVAHRRALGDERPLRLGDHDRALAVLPRERSRSAPRSAAGPRPRTSMPSVTGPARNVAGMGTSAVNVPPR